MKGNAGMILIDSNQRTTEIDVRVGTRNTRLPGPLGTGEWERDDRSQSGRHPAINPPYQEISYNIIEDARIRIGDVEIPCHRATNEELILLDATFALVPPNHLQLVNQRKPQGFLISDTTGRGNSLSYMGGLNATVDYSSTPNYNESELILITHGALWENRELGICPTVLHEIGHVLTHRGEINYGRFPDNRRTQLEGTRVSRNPGRLEALCNAYMFFLCYGSTSDLVHNYGSRPITNQKDLITRNALRECQAFRILNEEWDNYFAER